MKKILALILSAVLLLSLSGCVKIYRQAWDGFCYTSYDEPVELDKEAVNYILDIMNSGKWQSGNIKCPSDYYFSLQLGRVGYVSDEGYFNDFTLQRSMKLTDEQHEKVNEFLFSHNRVKIVGRVTEKYDGGCLIEITSDTEENVMAEGTPVMVHIGDAECPEYEVGDVLIIIFNGMVAESYPPQIFSVYEVYKSYDGALLNKISYTTIDYNGGYTVEYLIDFDENTVKYRGFLPYEESEPEYKLVKEFTDKDEEILLNKLYSNGFFTLKEYYKSPLGIIDGGGWELIIEYADGSIRESGGSNNSPKYIFSGCAKAFYDLCGYGIVGYVSPDYYSPPNISYTFSKKNNGGMMNYSSFCHRGDYSWNGFGSSGNDIYELNVAKKTPYQYYADEEYKLLIYTANYNNIYNYEKFTSIKITSYDYNESLTNEKEVYSGGWFSQVSIDIELNKIYLVRLDFDNGDFVEWTFNTLTTEKSE